MTKQTINNSTQQVAVASLLALGQKLFDEKQHREAYHVVEVALRLTLEAANAVRGEKQKRSGKRPMDALLTRARQVGSIGPAWLKLLKRFAAVSWFSKEDMRKDLFHVVKVIEHLQMGRGSPSTVFVKLRDLPESARKPSPLGGRVPKLDDIRTTDEAFFSLVEASSTFISHGEYFGSRAILNAAMEIALRRLDRASDVVNVDDDDEDGEQRDVSAWKMLKVLKACSIITRSQEERIQATLTRRADISAPALSELRHVAVAVIERAKLLEASREHSSGSGSTTRRLHVDFEAIQSKAATDRKAATVAS